MDLGLLVLRLVVGGLFVGHGTQKLFGWFGGGGIGGTAGFLGSLGYRGGAGVALLAGATEATSGALLMMGLLTPFAAAGIIGVMLNAIIAVHAPKGLWVSNGGYEYPLALIAVSAALGFAGPGSYSLDAAIGWSPSGLGWGLVAIALGFFAGITLAWSRRMPAAAEEPRQRRRAA